MSVSDRYTVAERLRGLMVTTIFEPASRQSKTFSSTSTWPSPGEIHLNRQVRRPRPESFCFANLFEPFPAHEGHVRRSHGVGIASEPEPRLGGVHGTEVVSLDVTAQRNPNAHRYAAVYVLRRQHPAQLSPDELIPEPIIGRAEQLFGGNVSTNDVHSTSSPTAQRSTKYRSTGVFYARIPTEEPFLSLPPRHLLGVEGLV